jgi:hypothetical protein
MPENKKGVTQVRTYLSAALALVALVFVFSNSPARAQDDGYDIVIAIDASRSVIWNDDGNLSNRIVRTILDLARDRSGDRVAIVNFAAWNETRKNGIFLFPPEGDAEFPLKTVPAEQAERNEFFDNLKDLLDKNLKPFGRGTDLNLAFEKGIFEVNKAREKIGSKNQLRIVLFTDGFFDVVEDEVRSEYKEAAQEKYKSVDRETLNRAAFDYFAEKVYPALKELKKKEDFIIDINDFTNVERGKEDALKLLSELEKADHVKVNKQNMPRIMKDLVASWAQKPPSAGKHSKVEAGGGETVEHPFHIYQGVKLTNVIVIADTAEYETDIAGKADGKSILSKSGVETIGEKEATRIFNLRGLPSGDYVINIVNPGSGNTTFDISVFFPEFELMPQLACTGAEGKFLVPGDKLEFTLTLSESVGGPPVTDSQFIKELSAELVIKDPASEETRIEAVFADPGKALATKEFTVGQDAKAGKFTVTAEFRGIKATDEEAFSYKATAGPLTFSIKPGLTVDFEKTSGEIGKSVVLIGTLNADAPAGNISVTIMEKDTKEKRPVNLEESGAVFKGEVIFDNVGSWEVVRETKPEYVVVPGRKAAFAAKEPAGSYLLYIIIAAAVILVVALLIFFLTRKKPIVLISLGEDEFILEDGGFTIAGGGVTVEIASEEVSTVPEEKAEADVREEDVFGA